ncbi:MAG: phosphoribosylaminoimidazolesuccinocarboxamide synthase [Candidatus Peregrinibacteria bacterium]|nr:phosphoribosylaminoimidazolesuccinocarboxamide synthase [Candidatus Peregrinibacteria bacterium]MDZ4245103.1 phosphoribosylaminoimidazolesuccinocarboxamide synthase [Candidatus Gracilibacteria bacterium]
MLTNEQLKAQIPYVLKGTDFNIGTKYEGKVRDNYTFDGKRLLVVTDRLSAFDRIIANIPFKGQVLNQLAKFWFEKTKDIVGNHVIEFPDPNAILAKECKPLPIEMVVRAYITGSTTTSAWYNYEKGVRNFCGNELPEGLKKNQKLAHPIITPSTKALQGDHDESVSGEEILRRTDLTAEQFDHLSDISLKLFARGVEIAAKQGVILVDTKYEFGVDPEGNVVLIDEIHTPDSSRFWLADTYEERMANGEEQDNINKEYLRLYMANQGYIGEGEMPTIPEEVIVETARRYIEAYEMITGETFMAKVGDVYERIKSNLAKYGA